MLQMLIGPVANLASTFLEGQVEKTKAKAKAKVIQAESEAIIMQKKATGEIDWDIEAIKNSGGSWKDEYLTIVISIPLILAFIPGMEGVVQNGFQQLQQAPDWYFYTVGLCVSASFGIRGATKFFKR